jgi:uncharacterized Zn-finger protein
VSQQCSIVDHMTLKIHDAAFTCPFEGCGRSFSVLSNMRRHARVHTLAPQFRESFSDEEIDRVSPPPRATIGSHNAATVASSASNFAHPDNNPSNFSSRSRRGSLAPDDKGYHYQS